MLKRGSPRQKVLDPALFVALHDGGKCLGQIAVRLDSVQLAGLYQGGQHGPVLGPGFVTREETVLATDGDGPDDAFDGVVIGRKNYLFVGSQTGGRAAAIAYTLIETAKLNGVDPLAWLADTLARIPDYKINRVDDLLPWKAAS